MRLRPLRVAPVALAVALALGAATPAPAQERASTPEIDAFVDRAYADLLGREPTGHERTRWTGSLAAGTPRLTFTRALVQSAEFEADLVEVTYLVALGRTPDAAGRAFWEERLAERATTRTMESAFLRSGEFEARNGGTDGAVRALFAIALQRPAAEGDVAHFSAVPAGARTNAVLGSTEAARVDVATAFLAYLGRLPDAAGRDHWAAALRASGDEQGLWAAVVASGEYGAQGAPTDPQTTPSGDPLGTVLAARLAAA